MEKFNRYPIRKPTRIPHYSYSECNYYFVTVCTCNKECIFGSPQNLSLAGKIARQEMENLSGHYNRVYVDKFVVMPNHVHAIIVMDGEDGITGQTTLNSIVGSYKSGVSKRIKEQNLEMTVWQRSFHDHVIRNQVSYEKIWNYIEDNPRKWNEDCFYRA